MNKGRYIRNLVSYQRGDPPWALKRLFMNVYTYNMYDILKIAGLITRKNSIIVKIFVERLKIFLFSYILYISGISGINSSQIPADAGLEGVCSRRINGIHPSQIPASAG